jgi:hypothetical protein
MTLSPTDITNITTSANTLFNSAAFLAYPVPSTLQSPPPFTITATVGGVSTTIPAVSEWTWATGSILVFNTLNSCVGITGINSTTKKILGIHLSMRLESATTDIYSAPVNKVFTDNAGFNNNKSSFGKSQAEWRANFNGFPSATTYPPIINDMNERKWIFWLDDNKALKSHSF